VQEDLVIRQQSYGATWWLTRSEMTFVSDGDCGQLRDRDAGDNLCECGVSDELDGLHELNVGKW
jgi:hypothetical protein